VASKGGAAPVSAEEPGSRATAPLGWARAPQQDRSRKTLERILDATEEIIRERGVEAVTIPEVARAARSSVGSFYARFPDKATLLHTLHERACEQSIATAEAALEPARWGHLGTTALIRLFVEFAVRLFRERQPIMLAFSAALASDPGFAARRARTAAALVRLVQALLLPRRAEMQHPDPASAIAMSLRVVTATLEQRNSLELGGPEVTVADELLIDELTRMIALYLGFPLLSDEPAPPSHRSPKAPRRSA
jgi:AcrR family transcriptional regulator